MVEWLSNLCFLVLMCPGECHPYSGVQPGQSGEALPPVRAALLRQAGQVGGVHQGHAEGAQAGGGQGPVH